ncbi:Alpha/Beta hydrolase protein [Armillaria mellea]|nr:Alpha/Beta hydrolase protein [Armillaria mellea]
MSTLLPLLLLTAGWLVSPVLSQSLSLTSDSGVCETTDGVSQVSGYINISDDSDDAFWFWFFEARDDPDTKPLTLWLNGGPGCSAMIGLFQENGPCTINDSGETVYNPYSWNNFSNMIYIDQPFGAGFSKGSTLVNSTDEAAGFIWQAFQILFDHKTFSKFKGREFIIATESYGARFGPVFTQYFHSQNAKIESGEINGTQIEVSKLLINDGKHDPVIQMQASVDYARHAPSYGSLVNTSVLMDVSTAYNETCLPALQDCYDDGDADTCHDAIVSCTHDVFNPTVGDRNPNDLRQNSSTPSDEVVPPTFYLDYLHDSNVRDLIGAQVTYDQCDDSVKTRFSRNGETGRSFLSNLAEIASEGKVKLLIWAGDADMKANWLGVHECIASMDWPGRSAFSEASLSALTINGKTVGQYKAVADTNLTFVRVYEAGHSMPAYQPEVAQTVFARFLKGDVNTD